MSDSSDAIAKLLTPELLSQLVAEVSVQVVEQVRSDLLASVPAALPASPPASTPADDSPLKFRERFSFDNQALAIAALSSATFANVAQRVFGTATWDHILTTGQLIGEAAGYSSLPAFAVAIYCAIKARRTRRPHAPA